MLSGALLVVALASPAAEARSPGQTRRSVRLASRAEAASQDGRTADVLRLTERALRADPDHVRAQFLRAMAFFRLASEATTPPVLRDQATERFLQHLTRVAELDADGDLGAIARTTLADLQSTTLVPREDTACSATARAHFAAAEARFSANAFSDAASLYLKAAEACPGNATYRAWLGDAHFALGDLRTAQVHFKRAVELDPCHAMAQRFLADTHLQQGHPRGAWQALTAAVACDPGYEPGRAWLDGLVSEFYGFPAELDRQRPPAQWTASGEVVVDPRPPSGPDVFTPPLALAFAQGLASPISGAAHEELARTRAAIESSLAVYQTLPAAERPSSLFWPRMVAAEAHGCLDAAVFAFLITPRLVPAFLDVRSEDRAGLVACMQDVFAPLPGEGILAD